MIVEWQYSKDLPIFSDFDERKIYNTGKATKYMGHIDFIDFFFSYSLCVVMIKYKDGEHSVKTWWTKMSFNWG